MASRKSARISQKQSQANYNTKVNCSKKQVPTTTKPSRKSSPRCSVGVKRRGGGGGVCEGRGERGRANNSRREALDTTSEDATSYMRSVTNVLCTLFSVLTAGQIEQIEKSTNEIVKEDNLYNRCINHAKSAAAARDLSLKLATARNASNKDNKGKINSSTSEAIVTPQSIAHCTNKRVDAAAATPVAAADVPAAAPAAPYTNPNALITRNPARIGNNTETSSTTQSTNTAQPDWLRKLDENRKYNLILFGIHDTNNKYEDQRVVDDMLWTIGCQHRIANKTNIIRLGNKKPGRSRLLMVASTVKLLLLKFYTGVQI